MASDKKVKRLKWNKQIKFEQTIAPNNFWISLRWSKVSDQKGTPMHAGIRSAGLSRQATDFIGPTATSVRPRVSWQPP
jgi:hypothetical protein